jgi:hypothetical protein
MIELILYICYGLRPNVYPASVWFRKPELQTGHFSRSGSGGSRKMTGSSGIGIGTGYPVKHYRFSETTHWPDKHMGRKP